MNGKRNSQFRSGNNRTRHFSFWIAGFLFLRFSLSGFGMQGADNAELQRVLSQMEAVGKEFRTFAAKFTQRKYTAVLREFDTPEAGEFFYSRAKDGSALLRQDVATPGRRILTVKDGIATIHQPNIKQAQVANLGQHKDKAEYLALGIGQSPKKLQETFHLFYQGNEQINGVACSVLVLKPKSAKTAALFSSITLWVRKSSGIPIQQKLQEPSGDYLLVNFFEEKLNSKLPDSKFEQKLPGGTDIQRIQ